MSLVISKVTIKPIIIFQVYDNKSKNISLTDKNLFEKHNIFIDQENYIEEYVNK
jgi:hypothetical protein